jgi:D-3-phosphoglycerate dehydrogenase / 2-oxoglutarate reductase
MAYRVLVSDKLSAEGVQVLQDAAGCAVDVKTGLSPEDQRAIIGGYEGLIIRSATTVDKAMLEAARSLKIVIRAGIGVDNIDVPACTAKGVLVENTPSGNAVSAAEHAIAMLFSLARKIPQAHMSTTQGKWEKSAFNGMELTGKTLGVIGAGNIGAVVCDRARGLAMRVIAFDPVLSDERAKELGIAKVSLDELLRQSDAITLHVPLIPATTHIINAESLKKMKRGALLVNAARGGVVDERAVVQALDEGHLGGAAFDVFENEPLEKDSPLLGRPDVVLTPHLGASTSDAQIRVGVEAAEQVVAFLDKGEIRNAINKV